MQRYIGPSWVANDAVPIAEQVGQDALIDHLDARRPVTDRKRTSSPVPLLPAGTIMQDNTRRLVGLRPLR